MLTQTHSGKVEVNQLENQQHQFMEVDQISVEKGQDTAAITWTPEEEKAALRKLDWNLIPL